MASNSLKAFGAYFYAQLPLTFTIFHISPTVSVCVSLIAEKIKKEEKKPFPHDDKHHKLNKMSGYDSDNVVVYNIS